MSTVTSEFCFILSSTGKAESFSLKRAEKIKNKPVWIHIDGEDKEHAEWLREKSGLDEVVIDNLLDEDPQPRYFTLPQGIFIVLRGVNLNRHADVEDMIALRIWIDRRQIISVSHQKLPSVEKIGALLEKGKGPATPMNVFIRIAEVMNDGISTVVSRIEDELDDIEEAVIDADRPSSNLMRSQISEIRHRILGLRRYLGPQRDVFIALKSLDNDAISKKDRVVLREISRDLSKSVEDLDYARDHITVSQEELDSRISLQISQTMYLLSVMTIIFAPLTLFTSLLGSNIGGIPWNEHPFGFWYVSLILLVIGILMVLLLKWRKWF